MPSMISPMSVAEFIRQPFVDHAADDRCLRLLTAEDERSGRALLLTVGECAIDRLDNVAAFTEVARDRSTRSESAHRPGSR